MPKRRYERREPIHDWQKIGPETLEKDQSAYKETQRCMR
jgi:hypothetical protein